MRPILRTRWKLVLLALCACSMTVMTVTADIAPDSGVFSSSFEYRQRFAELAQQRSLAGPAG